MIALGLSAHDLRAFHAQLATHHRVAVAVDVLTLSHARVSSVSDRLIDGQINMDASAEITRSCSLTLLDADHSLSFDSTSPADSAFFLDRMIRVTYSVFVDSLARWVHVPAFTGPVSKMSRDGDQVSIEAQGKESLAMNACWRPLNIGKGARKTSAIVTILRERAGESRFSIPVLSSRLPKALSLDREAVPWKSARSLASSLSRQLFYNGSGTCVLRTMPASVLYTWNGSTMTSPLQIDYGEASCNTVWVKGATPKGHKTPLTYSIAAPSSNPLSPYKLGRNGVPRYLLKVITDDKIRTLAEAKTRANAELASELVEHVSATFDSLPIPHLEPNDLVHVTADEGSLTFRLTKFSLPLVLGNNSPMTVGYARNVSLKTRKRRHR